MHRLRKLRPCNSSSVRISMFGGNDQTLPKWILYLRKLLRYDGISTRNQVEGMIQAPKVIDKEWLIHAQLNIFFH